MALTICSSYLRLKDMLGAAYSTAELTFELRKSMINSGDSLYLAKQKRQTVMPGKVIQDILYVSKDSTVSVTVAYTAGGTAGAEVVTVTSGAISVQIQTAVSTATQVKAAILASAAASALVYAVISGTAATAQVTASAASLSDEYFLMALSETTTDANQGIFTINWNDGSNYNSIIFDPILIPNQSAVDLSTILTISRG